MPNQPAYEKHITAFVDFLGFSEAAFSDPNLTRAILSGLQALSSLRSEANIRWEGKADELAFNIRPAMSAFSDHIVISYPISQIHSIGDTEHVYLSLALTDLRNRVGFVAALAFGLGFLIRGGISIGGLYHSGGIVFGEALVEAYRLESRKAINPRIVFSEGASEHPEFRGMDNRLFHIDKDGLYCFEYIYPMLMSITQERPVIRGITLWYKENIKSIESNISALERGGKEHEASKWRWFRDELKHSITRHGAGSALT